MVTEIGFLITAAATPMNSPVVDHFSDVPDDLIGGRCAEPSGPTVRIRAK